MALPTAPLGQLPSMNMPYSIPRYEQPASIWEKALASFLVNAAGGAASQGVENVMARDYAGDFGEKPATGFSKLLGPKVGAQDARLRKGQQFEQSMQASSQEAARKLAETNQQHDYDMERLRELNSGVARQEGFTNASDMEYLKTLNEGDQLRRQIEGQLGLAKEKQNLENTSPLNVAQTSYYQGQGAKAQSEADFNRSLTIPQIASGTTPPASGGPSPEDIAAAQALAARGKAGVAAPQEALSLEQQIQKWLSEGKNPEDIKLLLNPGPNTTKQNKVQDQLILQDANTAASAQQQAQTIQEIMRAAGLLSQPNTRRDLNSVY